MKLFTTFLAVLWTLDVHAQGTFIWSADNWSGNTIAAPGGSWQIAFDHVSDPRDYWDPWTPPSQHPVTMLFSMSLVTNDTGRTFFANALNEPGFGGFVGGLTDGANNYIRFQDGSPNALRVYTEQGFLGRTALAPDLAGYNITEIGFRVNNFYDYFDVQEDRYFRTLDYSLDFYGSVVPEPSTYALLTLAAAALLLRRKARRPTTE